MRTAHKARTITCPYCGEPAPLVTGAEVYPHRRDLRKKKFWKCTPCAAWVGCHPKSNEPLGRLANYELRGARKRAHDAFDPLWKGYGANREMTRESAYTWLSCRLRLPRSKCHIGMFDVLTCRKVLAVCRLRRERKT